MESSLDQSSPNSIRQPGGYQDLIRAIHNQNIVIIVGAGVSQAVASLPSWIAACKSALDHALAHELVDEDEHQELNTALESTNTSQEILQVAGHIRTCLSGDQGAPGEFGAWLFQTFQTEPRSLKSLDIVNQILAVTPGFIATTNYDRILSSADAGRRTITWREHSELLNALRRNEPCVGHLHGIFDSPRTVVWGEEDYQNLLSDNSFQEILKILWVERTLVFVGCSINGATDPSFRTLMDWCANHFPELDHKHFLLTKAGDVNKEVKSELLRNRRLQIVEFGNEHEDLPSFLANLAIARNTNTAVVPTGTYRSSSSSNLNIAESTSDIPDPAYGKFPRRVRSFQGGDNLLSKLDAIFASPTSTPVTAVITGMSGSGKSQLCLEYIRRSRNKYSVIWWIDAQTHSAVEGSLAALANFLEIEPHGDESSKARSDAAVNWLNNHDGWLLIFDATQPDLIHNCFPNSGGGHILITSTNPNWASFSENRFAVEGWDQEDSLQFLSRRLDDVDRNAAAGIAEQLGGLPLALEQVASYIEQTGISIIAYEQLLGTARVDLLSEPSSFTDYPMSVYSAIKLNVELLFERVGSGLAVLMYASFFLPRNIPRNIVMNEVELAMAHYGEEFSQHKFNLLLAEISKSSLLEIDEETISMHPLVQTFIRDSMDRDTFDGWAFAVLTSLSEAFPAEIEDSRNWNKSEALIEHVLNAMILADFRSWGNEHIEALYSTAGSYQYLKGYYEEAVLLHEVALRYSEERDGANSPSSAQSMNNLMLSYNEVGRVEDAITTGEHAKKILSKNRDYADDLGKLLSNLARIYLHKKRFYQFARSLLKQAFAIHKNLHGYWHVTCAIDLNNLGTISREEAINAGRSGNKAREKIFWVVAREYFRDAVTIHRKLLLPNDYRLGIALYNLGQAENNLENLEFAEILLTEAIRVFEYLPANVARSDLHAALMGFAYTLDALDRPEEASNYFLLAANLRSGVVNSGKKREFWPHFLDSDQR